MTGGDLGGAKFTVGADTRPFEAGMRRAQRDAKRTRQVVANEAEGMSSAVSRNLDRVGRSIDQLNRSRLGKSSRIGQGMMELGYIVDDLQYGFHSVVNNIPQVVAMFGGGAGLAAGVTVAAVAINQLSKHWGELTDSMRSAWLNVPADHLEKLRIRAEKATEAFDKLARSPSKLEEKQIDVLTDVIRGAEGGQPMIIKGLREAILGDPLMKPKLEPGDAVEIAKRMALKATGRAVKFQPAMGLKDLEAEVKKEMLGERLDQIVRETLGGALAPGEGREQAFANFMRLIKDHPGSFRPKFLKAMQAADLESVDHAEANRDAARMMMHSRVGTDLMLAGPEKKRVPMSKDQISRLLRDNRSHIRLGGLEFDAMHRAMEEAGTTEAEGREVMGGMRTRDVVAYARKNNINVGKAIPRMFAARMKAVRDKKDPLEASIDARLKAAGIEGDAPGVRREMRKLMDDRLKSIMLEKGVTQDQARLIMLREQAQHAFPGFGGPAQVTGVGEFGRQVLTGGMSLPEIGKRQLAELQEIRKAITEGKQQANAATLAGAVGGAAMAVAAGPN